MTIAYNTIAGFRIAGPVGSAFWICWDTRDCRLSSPRACSCRDRDAALSIVFCATLVVGLLLCLSKIVVWGTNISFSIIITSLIIHVSHDEETGVGGANQHIFDVAIH